MMNIYKEEKKSLLPQKHSALLCVWLFACGSIVDATEGTERLTPRQIDVVGAVQSIVEETFSPDHPERRIVFTRIFAEDGKVAETTISLIDSTAHTESSKRRTVVIRDAAGRVIEERIWGSGEVPIGKQLYKYDSDGRLVEKETYEADESQSTKWLYRYDDRGNEKEMSYYIQGVLKARYVYETDEKGNKFKTVAFKSDGSLEFTTVDQFDRHNRRVESVTYTPAGKIDRRQAYKYNEAGYVVELLVHNNEGIMIDRQVSAYEFDKKGNWVQRVTAKSLLSSEKTETVEVARRRITYRDKN